MKIEKGVKVFITGAASGIGRATAVAMGRMGARLFITDINEPGLVETGEMVVSAGGEVAMLRAFDITSFEAVKAFADDIHAEFGPLHIIINNAGIALYALVEDMTHDHWAKVINTNLWGPIHGIESFIPEMIKAKRGHLVNVSSTAGLIGEPWHVAYSAAKWGLVGISEVLLYDLMQHNIGVTVICPGYVNTPLKHTVEILAVDRESKRFKKLFNRVEKHAIPPERVAEQIVNAIEKKKFIVITSFDIKALYFFKRHFHPLYHFAMKIGSKLFNSMKTK